MYPAALLLSGVIVNGETALGAGIFVPPPPKAVPQGWSVKEHEREHAAGTTVGVKKVVWSYDVTVAPYAIVASGVAIVVEVREQSSAV